MTALEQWQSSISHNIANSSVAGFKSTDVRMQNSQSSKEVQFEAELDNAMVKAESKTNFQQGQIIASGKPLDFAIEGDGFFEVLLPDGDILYTRDGEFHINESNQLVNKNGYPVRSANGPLQLTPNGGALRIDPEGNAFQGQVQLGQIALTQIRDKDQLQPVSGGFVARSGEEFSTSPAEVTVMQGYIEAGNTNPIKEMVQLIAVSRAYEANQKVIQTGDRLLERATTTFGPQ